jgi:PhnB protein
LPDLNGYLLFNGNCAEAMRFYQRTLGGKLELMTYGESPIADRFPPDNAKRILHASLAIDGGVLLAADLPAAQSNAGMNGFRLALSFPTATEARRIFDALAEEGKATLPLQKTFWSEAFGEVVDRFGTPWMINGPGSTA